MAVALDLTLMVSGENLDGDQLDETTRQLKRELLDLDVDLVTSGVGGPAPAGTRGVDVETVGQLLVGVGASLEGLRRVLLAVRAWRARQRSVKIQVSIGADRLELTDASPENEELLVQAFLRRHASTTPDET